RVEPSMCHVSPRRVDKALLLLQVASLLAALSSARATDYYVDPSDGNTYATVQDAVDAVAGQSEFNRANIFIAPGTYREIVTVNKPYISFIGEGSSPHATTIVFSRGLDSFSYGQVVEIQDSATAFMARNVTFENSIPARNVTAALGVRSSADRVRFVDVRFSGLHA